MNTRALFVAIAALVTIVVLFVAATGPLRGLFGDVVVIVLGVSALAAVGAGSARQRIVGMWLLGCGLEGFQLLQWVGPDAHWLAHMFLGSTADPLDVGAYSLGALLSAVLERTWAPGKDR